MLAALCGLALIVLGAAAGHAIGYPETVEQRVEIWRQPWRNTVRGGDQVAHSLWGLASGGWQGSGIGMGSPSYLPAGHTDLILSAAGEELGFAGLACIFLLYSLLIWRSLRIALRAPTSYSFFLATGLALIVALQLLLIAGGLLDLIPLSGVVSPFLSYGKSSMIATCAVFGIMLAISARTVPAAEAIPAKHFGRGMRVLGATLAACLLVVVARAALHPGRQSQRLCAARRRGPLRRWRHRPRIQPAHRRYHPASAEGRHLRPQRAAAGHQQYGAGDRAQAATTRSWAWTSRRRYRKQSRGTIRWALSCSIWWAMCAPR